MPGPYRPMKSKMAKKWSPPKRKFPQYTKPLQRSAMSEAIRMHIDRANDRSQERQMVKKNTVNPNKLGPGYKKAVGRQVRPLPGLSGANIAKRPGFAPIRRPKPRPIRRPGFGPGSGKIGPGPR